MGRGLLRLVLLGTACLAGFGGSASGQTVITTRNVITTPGATSVTLGGQTFTNQGLLGMGRIPAGTRDFNNDSLGAFSGMDIDLSTWRRAASGYTGSLIALPDRGPNGVGQVTFSDYAARVNTFGMAFTPYTGAADLPPVVGSQNQLALTQTGGFLFRDFNGNVTTGFDPVVGAASVITQNGIQLPGINTGPAAGKISMDAEGIRFLRDKSFYVSDEYGSNVYYFDRSGRLQGVIRPPAALIPRDAAGNISYSSTTNPVTGRRPNQGLEGLAVTPDGRKLVTLAQSATIQDSTAVQQTRTNTRLMIYDISASRTPTAPTSTFVVQLPVFNESGTGAPNRTAAQSELLALNDTQFLVLSRDGLGLGTNLGNSVFKSVLLIDTTGATNIAGTNFETTTAPISPNGVLSTTIRPTQQVELVNMLNSTQLAKFGSNLNNTTPNRLTLAEKWEGMALAPVLEENAPQDFFLFVGNDNDFLSTNCSVNGQNCAQTVDSDPHVLVYRLTLPTYVDPEYRAAMVEGGPVILETLSQAGVGVARGHLSSVGAHLDAARRAGSSSGFMAWASGNYSDSSWDDFTRPGVGAKTDGLRGSLGFEYGLAENAALGLAVGYGDAENKVDGGFSAKVDGYHYGVTARYAGENVFVTGSLSRGDLKGKDITRPGAYGLTARGNTDAKGTAGQIEAGYMIAMGKAKLGPIAGFTYTKLTYDAYTETGAAGGNINMPEVSLNARLMTVGGEASLDLGSVRPFARLAFNGQDGNSSRVVGLKLASATAAMATEAVTLARDKDDFISAGFGVQGSFGAGLWHVGYTSELGDADRTSHALTAGVGFAF
jgi:uncharacterized protein YhjY with autotransporter beta-barrel domain